MKTPIKRKTAIDILAHIDYALTWNLLFDVSFIRGMCLKYGLIEISSLADLPAEELAGMGLMKANVIESECWCGEKISVEINSQYSPRADKKRPFYSDCSAENSTSFRCRKCFAWLGDSCPAASFDKPKPPEAENEV
jgi:hypothetical protein